MGVSVIVHLGVLMMKELKMLKILCISIILTAGYSQAGQFAISVDNDRLNAGEKVGVSLIFLENGSGEVPDFPGEIICELITRERKFAIPANKDIPEGESGESGETESSDNVQQHYSFILPSELRGQVVLSLGGLDAPRVVIDVTVPRDESIEETEKVYPTLDSMFTISQPYEKNASAYEPVYFVLGTELEKSKFQISFKYRFFDADSLFAKSNPWVTGLHFGYTQTSFWDLESASAPFDDTSYKPELFWLSRNFLGSEHGLLKGVFFQSGFQHESNGKAEDFSRSTNYLYIKPILVFYDDDSKLGLQLSSKIWSYVENDGSTNPDLADYRGYFDLEAKFGMAEGIMAGTHFRMADQGGSFQFDISYPLNNIFGDALDVYFYAQYSNVLAESLLDYQERTQALRFGLAFIR
jgi:outer membrane phospholipase A